VFIGLLLLFGDLSLIAGLVVTVVVSARRMRRYQPARPCASARRWVALIAAFTTLGLVVAGNAWLLIYSYEQGRPAMSQAAGTWTDGLGATLHILPDGTFTAADLPADADSSTGRDVILQALPADEHGTWKMTRGDGTWYLLCSLSGGPQFQFYVILPASPGDPPRGADFTYVQGQFGLPTVNLFDKTVVPTVRP